MPPLANSISRGKLNITTADGTNVTLTADTIMTALTLGPNREAMNKFKDKAPAVYFVGDYQDPKLIADATASGALIAHSL